MSLEIQHTNDFLGDAVALIAGASEEAIRARGVFRIALSGGNTPRPVYRALAGLPLDWDRWEVTFGDERCVPPDSGQSNFRMARESLFDHVPIPAGNILRMRGEGDPAEAAAEYEADLVRRAAGGSYRHDLILLGMGDDGHTASLFPGTEALGETGRLVAANFVPKFSASRITFTYPLLNAALHVCFLVSSPGKEAILEEVFGGASSYPCAAVRPTDGRVTWLLGGGA